MDASEARDKTSTARRELQVHFPPIMRRGMTGDQFTFFEFVHAGYGRVMAHLEAIAESRDRHPVQAFEGLQGEQRLILFRSDVRFAGEDVPAKS